MNRWIDGIQLKDRWKTAPHSILEAVEAGLKVYESLDGGLNEIKFDNFKTAFKRYSCFSIEQLLESVYFNLDDIVDFEMAEGENFGPIDAKERRHYGLLKAERDNIDNAIQASVRAASYCEKHSPVLKKDFLDFIDKKHEGLPRTIVDKIWRSIPRNHKKGPGAPQKTAKK